MSIPHAKTRLHLDHIDGLRALAALYVVCVHTVPRIWAASEPQNRLLGAMAKALSGGHFAVTVFIVVSGFCLMLPVTRAGMEIKGGLTGFFTRRYRRIAPVLYATFVLSAVLLFVTHRFSTGTVPGPTLTFTQFMGHLLILQFVIPHAMLPNNPVLWSITVEWLIYFWFPLMVVAWRKWGAVWATLLFVLVTFGLSPVLDRIPILANITIHYVGAFAIGALGASIAYSPTPRWLTLRARIPWNGAALCLALLTAILVAGLGWKRVYDHILWFDVPVSVSAVSLLIGTALNPDSTVRRLLAWRPLVAVGVFSYSLYAVHFPLAELICGVFLSPFKMSQMGYAALMFLGVIPIIVGSAYLFAQVFEMPFLSRRGRTVNPRAEVKKA